MCEGDWNVIARSPVGATKQSRSRRLLRRTDRTAPQHQAPDRRSFMRRLRFGSPPRNDNIHIALGTFISVLFIMTQIVWIPGRAWAQPTLPTDASAEPQTAHATQTGDRLYLDFKKASLLNVLIILSELTGINFVAGKEVAPREVNMVLDDVKLEDALVALSKGSNVTYDYFPDRNLYLFRAAAEKEDVARLETRVFKLYYVRASELREIQGGEGGGGGGGTTSGASFTVLKETQTAGQTTSSIMKIVESMLSERGKVTVDDRSNSLVVTDTEDRLRMVEAAISQLDRPVDQVLIKVILIETFEDLDRFLGIEWSGNTTAGQEGTLGVIGGSSQTSRFPFNARLFHKNLFNIHDESRVAENNTVTLGAKDFSDLDMRIRALQTAGKTQILARPKILVLDNHPALIKITTNEAVGNQSATAGVAATSVVTQNIAERTETGTSLRVTPLINTNNRITMTLEPRFVTATTAASGLGNTRDPTIRTARTTLMVNDGQTIVLGGLLSSQQTNSVRKVPFLGDIPFLGEIFTRRSKQFDDRELILFVNPSIVRDPSEVQAVSVPDYRERFDDATAPFWKWKRKDWYRNLKKETTPEATMESGVYIAARDRMMDGALTTLAAQLKEAGKAPAPVPSKK